jgi:glycosyltransferase involved in cell wall biosynthesis
MSKIVWISDFDFTSSGYFNISTSLCAGLSQAGHEVKAIGWGYKGEEHNFPFGIIPATNIGECMGIAQNLKMLWEGADKLVVALDIPLQQKFLEQNQKWSYEYTGIFPLEARPLTMTWAMHLIQMKHSFVISEFGAAECQSRGIPSVYLPIGIDRTVWRKPSEAERVRFRNVLFNAHESDVVVLTVADNQERKNLAAAMEAFAEFSKEFPTSRYVLVTREDNPVGWKLNDLAAEYGILDRFIMFRRGMPATDLWALYAAADLFVLPSKAEGLGLPLREAMAVGLKCVGTDCTGIREQLKDGRGWLASVKSTYRDTFGNGFRYLVDEEALCEAMKQAVRSPSPDNSDYVSKFTWDKAVDLLNGVL